MSISTGFGTAPDGRLFGGVRGGDLPTITYRRAWIKARQTALSAAEQASPLARRPYDLRHACLSTWLNGGLYPTQMAEWAGHSVDVLLRIYAKCVVGQDDSPSAESSRRFARTYMDAPTRRAPRKRPGSCTMMILDLGTYWAQRPAFRRPRLRTTAHRDDRQIARAGSFRRSQALICGF